MLQPRVGHASGMAVQLSPMLTSVSFKLLTFATSVAMRASSADSSEANRSSHAWHVMSGGKGGGVGGGSRGSGE